MARFALTTRSVQCTTALYLRAHALCTYRRSTLHLRFALPPRRRSPRPRLLRPTPVQCKELARLRRSTRPIAPRSHKGQTSGTVATYNSALSMSIVSKTRAIGSPPREDSEPMPVRRVQPNDVESRAADPNKTQRASTTLHRDLVLHLREPPHEGQPTLKTTPPPTDKCELADSACATSEGSPNPPDYLALPEGAGLFKLPPRPSPPPNCVHPSGKRDRTRSCARNRAQHIVARWRRKRHQPRLSAANWRSSAPAALTLLTHRVRLPLNIGGSSSMARRPPSRAPHPTGPRRISRCRPPSAQHSPYAPT